jgi:RND family efflux transporter MFP subunit
MNATSIDERPSFVTDGRTDPAVAAPAAAAPKGKAKFAWRILVVGAVIAVGVGALYVVGTLPRLWHDKEVQSAAAAKAAAPLVVATAAAHRSPTDAQRGLPGNCLPMLETSLYARTNGFIQERLVDIGDRVKADQRLAVIAAPDVDDQLVQSKADLSQAEANLNLNKANAELARTTLARDQAAGLIAVPAQQVDQDRASYETARASVKAAEASILVYKATVQRYADLVSFQEIKAPFHGVITVRNYDKGALIIADSTAALPMFHVAQIDVVRVFVNVPQIFASQVQPGQTAVVYRQEHPGRKFSGKVTRTASALDPNTRTMLTQVDVPNPDAALLPGMYLQVDFNFPRQEPSLMIPSEAVTHRADGDWVGVLDGGNAVHYQKVQLGRDFGMEIEVLNGLSDATTVIVRPGDELPDGMVVQPAIPGPAK